LDKLPSDGTPLSTHLRPSARVTGMIIVATIAAPILGGLATSRGVNQWYTTLITPSWNPPSWLFGPVWTVLYCMMGIAAILAYRGAQLRGMRARALLTAYFVQLCLNTAWSFIFFWAMLPGWALAEILVLLVMIIVTMILFWKVRPLAGLLLVPYALWVSFATVLNWSLWSLNRS
jgi:benzodiazapine receptor